jgi:alpha-L-rhamnosidase
LVLGENSNLNNFIPMRTQKSFFITGWWLSCLAGLLWGCQLVTRQEAIDPDEWRYALALDAASGANQPYPALNGGAFDGPVVGESPDPLINYRWKETNANDDLQVYTLRPVTAIADVKDAFVNLESATGANTAITVNGTGSIRLDFGVESAAWLEFDSPDLAGNVEMSISEYNQPAVVNDGPEHPVKTAVPVKYGNTYRLELNSELYEGVRFGWVHVQSFTHQWHITGIRLVCQTKPTNYKGSFSCSDTLLTKIWYTGAYGVKLNLTKDYFGAILMDRGDRISWTGDAHPSQAAALVAFGNYDFIKKNIDNTSGQNNGIRSYSLYWVLSLVDYFNYTGDTNTLKKYAPNACEKLDDALRVYGTTPELRFYGWDERLGAGFEQPSCQESQNAYKMLTIRAWKEFASAMGESGRTDLQEKYNGYADTKIALLRQNNSWYQTFGLHANADAVTTGLLNTEEKEAIFEQDFTDRVTRISFSPFNQYFVIQAFARMNKHDDALSSIRDLWGGMIQYGGTTLFEDFRPSWNKVIGKNDPVPNNQAGYTSLCHPWGGGVTKWLSEEVLGIKPTSPGFSTFDITPHLGRTLTSVSGITPTPHGAISASFNVSTGACAISVPDGTVARIGIPKVEKTINSIKVNGTLAWDGAFHAVSGIGDVTSDYQYVYLIGVKPGSYSVDVSYTGMTPSYAEPQESWPAHFIGEDSTTSGNWGKVYGKEGFVLCNYNGNRSDKTMLPDYISSFTFHKANVMNNASPLVWSFGTSDTRAPAPDSGNAIPRNAACMFTDWATMSFTFTIEGTRQYSIALYFLDWDDKGRRIAVEMMDAETLNQIAPVKIIGNFKGGRYLIYSYDKSARFRIHQVRGDNAVLSGIFFDPVNGGTIQRDYKTDN